MSSVWTGILSAPFVIDAKSVNTHIVHLVAPFSEINVDILSVGHFRLPFPPTSHPDLFLVPRTLRNS